MADAVQFNSPRITLDEPKPLSYLENIVHKKVTNVALTCFESLVHWFLTTFSCFYPTYDKLYKEEVAKQSIEDEKVRNFLRGLTESQPILRMEDLEEFRAIKPILSPPITGLPPAKTSDIASTKSTEETPDNAAVQKLGTLPTSFEPTRAEDFDAIQTVPPALVAISPPAKEDNIASTSLTRRAINLPADNQLPLDIAEMIVNLPEKKKRSLRYQLQKILSAHLGNALDDKTKRLPFHPYVGVEIQVFTLKEAFLNTIDLVFDDDIINDLQNKYSKIAKGKNFTYTLEDLRLNHERKTRICTSTPLLDPLIQEALRAAVEADSKYVLGFELDMVETQTQNQLVFAIFEKNGEAEISRVRIPASTL